MPILASSEYQIVYNALSFVIATFLGGAFYFVFTREHVSPKYRASAVVSATILVIACYHYFRIFNSWEDAYQLVNGAYHPTGKPFGNAYRYVDWFLTVPLLVTETIIALGLPKTTTRGLYAKLTIAAGLMIVLGLPGQATDDTMMKAVWATLSTIPFIYVIISLWGLITRNLAQQPVGVRTYFANLRWLMLATWGVYPIVYAFPMLGFVGSTATVTEQLCFSAADVLAKAYFGLVLHWIITGKSEAEGFVPLS